MIGQTEPSQAISEIDTLSVLHYKLFVLYLHKFAPQPQPQNQAQVTTTTRATAAWSTTTTLSQVGNVVYLIFLGVYQEENIKDSTKLLNQENRQ